MHAQHFVANRLIAPDSGLRIKVFDPSSGEPFAEIARGNATDVSVAVRAALLTSRDVRLPAGTEH